MTTNMEGIYWENESFSDLDGSWSPSSSVSQYSDQENYHHLHQQNNMSFLAQGSNQLPQELSDLSGAISQAYAAFAGQDPDHGQLTQNHELKIPQTSLTQSCVENQSLKTPMSSPCSSSISSRSSSSHKKSHNPVKRVHQRNAANQRERRRMKTINDAFEGLRERIPLASNDRKLSKVDTLRLAITYIQNLTEMVNTCDSSDPMAARREQEAAKVIIRYHNSGFPSAYNEEPYATEQYPLYGHSLSWQGHKQMNMAPENKMAAKVWTPQVASTQQLEEMQSYVS